MFLIKLSYIARILSVVPGHLNFFIANIYKIIEKNTILSYISYICHSIPQTKLNLRIILFQVCEGFTIQSSAYLPGAVQPVLETILMMENALFFQAVYSAFGRPLIIKKVHLYLKPKSVPSTYWF